MMWGGSVPSGARNQCFASWQHQVGTTGNNSLVPVDVFSSLLGQHSVTCVSVSSCSLPPTPQPCLERVLTGWERCPHRGWHTRVRTTLRLEQPPNAVSAVCPVAGDSLSEAGGPWEEIVCETVSLLIPKPLTRSDSAFASSWQ